MIDWGCEGETPCLSFERGFVCGVGCLEWHGVDAMNVFFMRIGSGSTPLVVLLFFQSEQFFEAGGTGQNTSSNFELSFRVIRMSN